MRRRLGEDLVGVVPRRDVGEQHSADARSRAGLGGLTSGQVQAPRVVRVLEESRLRLLLDALGATSDLVIIDSGPVLSVSDPITLAAVCDHLLLVGERSWPAGPLARLTSNVDRSTCGGDR